ncbi:PilZ domain-containing protein [Marinobacter sp. F4216]|nr:PilZ domain-containing protein [Marinobacter sp. F4216]
MKPVAIKSNLRNQQRVDVKFDIAVETESGDKLTCTTINLSRSGVMISCNRGDIKKLIPTQQSPAPGHWIAVKTAFSVPVLAHQPVSVVADCNIVHMRRVARDEFHLGINFSEFEGNGFDYVDRYVAELLADSKTI